MTTRHIAYAKAIRRLPRLALDSWRVRGKPKVFGIGRNKTGTTSLSSAWRELGLIVGRQDIAELLMRAWSRRDFRWIIRYCRTAQAFQDIPFSLPDTYQTVDRAFPGSKFILTVRDSSEQWYNSLISYHAALFGHGHVPALEDLRAAPYVYRGFAYEVNRSIYQTPEDDPYNKDLLITYYEAHNQAVEDYFRNRPGDLLVLNVAEPTAYDRLCDFLGKPRVGGAFPWKNKTVDKERTR